MSGRSKFYALDVCDDLSRSGSSCSNEEQEQERLIGLDVSLSSSIDPSLKSSILPLIHCSLLLPMLALMASTYSDITNTDHKQPHPVTTTFDHNRMHFL